LLSQETNPRHPKNYTKIVGLKSKQFVNPLNCQHSGWLYEDDSMFNLGYHKYGNFSGRFWFSGKLNPNQSSSKGAVIRYNIREMVPKVQNIPIYIKVLQQLGWRSVAPYLAYQIQLRTGWLKKRTPTISYAQAAQQTGELRLPLFALPNPGYLRALLNEHSSQLMSQAQEIIGGNLHLFGGELRPLELSLPGELAHWTRHTASQYQGRDIKFIWEPGRFGWAITLGRAYLYSQNEDIARCFWTLTEEFMEANPPNLGPHWASGQEAALRLIALAFSAGLFLNSPHTTPARVTLLKGALATHASRIMASLSYARAQNNNHLITEAVGLYTAAAALPEHPSAPKWKQAGWHWLHHAIQSQIMPDGSYIQHSTNYHRLMLQAIMFAKRVAAEQYEHFPAESCLRLAAAARWLLAMLDQTSGGVPNLGGNDGAYILPLTSYPFSDYRPVVQAACQAFLDQHPLPPGPGDEMTLWLGGKPFHEVPETPKPDLLRLAGNHTWGYLRAAHFRHRPAHADQLHLDLWWRGVNITKDPGVYLYNGSPPWHNPLDATAVHNTLTVDQHDQMTKAGQFLWLDWAQAEVLDTSEDERGRLTWAVAQHNGYRRLKVIHRRTVAVEGDTWIVRDQLVPAAGTTGAGVPLNIRLHWLLPDWPWTFSNGILRLESGQGDVLIQLGTPDTALEYSLVRAGKHLLQSGDDEATRGWVSPTYGEKEPALSLAATAYAPATFTITTRIDFPE
jgi:hypothetical protein